MAISAAGRVGVLSALLGAAGASADQWALRSTANISVPTQPGFAQLPPEVPGKLVLTSFEAAPLIGKMAVYVLDVAGGTEAALPEKLPNSERVDWPNTATGADASIFGFEAVAIGSGFLVPGHTTGGVWVLEASSSAEHLPSPVKVTADQAGWFYHQAAFVDMDGDGRKDIVTARCQFGTFPWDKKQGELLWLQQPASDPLSGQPWNATHLADGPDFLFCLRPGGGPLALAAAEFTGGRISYHYMEDGAMKSRVIDSESGPGFSCSWVDLNGDGRDELLATNHMNKNGSVFAYTFDSDDLRTASITRHVLASGFNAVWPGQGFASPGDAIAFSPRTGDAGKPHILVSGDNSNSAFVLEPTSNDPADWGYAVRKIGDFGSDIGRPAVGDVDGDGFADIFLPLYDHKVLARFSYAPAESEQSLLV